MGFDMTYHKASDEALESKDELIRLMKSRNVPYGMLAEPYFDAETGENFGTSAFFTLSGEFPDKYGASWKSGDLYNFERYGLVSDFGWFDKTLDALLEFVKSERHGD